jgi:thioredoxin 1
VKSEIVLHLNEDDFDEEIRRLQGPVLVDFWASWCTPCKAIASALEQVALEMSGRAHVAKVDVDANGDLAVRFGVRSVPTLIVFKQGLVVDQMIGAAPKAEIRQLLGKHLD